MNVKNDCVELLLQQEYLTYAKVLAKYFNEVVIDENNKSPAQVDLDAMSIIIGKPFCEYGDDTISLALRHELSHFILDHADRAFAHTGHYCSNLLNIAEDVELSNYYSQLDVNYINYLLPDSCYVQSKTFEKYKGWKMEDVYDDLKKDNDERVQQFKQEAEELFNQMSPEQKQELKELADELKKEFQTTKQKHEDRLKFEKSGKIIYGNDDKCLFEIESEYKEVIRPQKRRTYTRENQVYAGTDVIIPSKSKIRRKSQTLHIFVDRSGSMDDEKTKQAEDVFEKLNYNKHMQIVRHTFSNEIDKDVGNGTNYNAIIRYCQYHGISDAAVITDDDHQEQNIPNYTFNKLFVIGVLNTTPVFTAKSKTIRRYSI